MAAPQTTASSTPHAPSVAPLWRVRLRAGVQAFEATQALRVQVGEQLRAVIQGRVGSGGELLDVSGDAESLLDAIRTGAIDGPEPFLGQLYRAAYLNEEAQRDALAALVAEHPAWPWVRCVKGVGVTLAARLLARIDIARAARPSSLWRYCGLATVEAEWLQCGVCGHGVAMPRGMTTPRKHRHPVSFQPCDGALERDVTQVSIRTAQRAWQGGRRPTFDRDAKRVCYLIGLSLSRQGQHFKEHYRRQKQRYASRHTWPKRRQTLAAIRHTVKTFLLNLWVFWRRAEHYVIDPSALAARGGVVPDPWRWVEVSYGDTRRQRGRVRTLRPGHSGARLMQPPSATATSE